MVITKETIRSQGWRTRKQMIQLVEDCERDLAMWQERVKMAEQALDSARMYLETWDAG